MRQETGFTVVAVLKFVYGNPYGGEDRIPFRSYAAARMMRDDERAKGHNVSVYYVEGWDDVAGRYKLGRRLF